MRLPGRQMLKDDRAGWGARRRKERHDASPRPSCLCRETVRASVPTICMPGRTVVIPAYGVFPAGSKAWSRGTSFRTPRQA